MSETEGKELSNRKKPKQIPEDDNPTKFLNLEYLLRKQPTITSAIELLKEFIKQADGLQFNSLEDLDQAWSAQQNNKPSDQKHPISTAPATSTSAETPRKIKDDAKRKTKPAPAKQGPIETLREIPTLLALFHEEIFSQLAFVRDFSFIDPLLSTLLRIHIAYLLQIKKFDPMSTETAICQYIDNILSQYNSLFTTAHLADPDKKDSLEFTNQEHFISYTKPEIYKATCLVASNEIERISKATAVSLPEFNKLLDQLLINCNMCNINILKDLQTRSPILCHYADEQEQAAMVGINRTMSAPIDDIVLHWEQAFLKECKSKEISIPVPTNQHPTLLERLKRFSISEIVVKSGQALVFYNTLLALFNLKNIISTAIDCLAQIIELDVNALNQSLTKGNLSTKDRPNTRIMVAAFKNAIALNDNDSAFTLLDYMLESYYYLAQEKRMGSSSSTLSSTTTNTHLIQLIEAFKSIFRFANNLHPTNETAQAIVSFTRQPTQLPKPSKTSLLSSSDSSRSNFNNSSSTSSSQTEKEKKESQAKHTEISSPVSDSSSSETPRTLTSSQREEEKEKKKEPPLEQPEKEPPTSNNGQLTPDGLKKLAYELNGENRPQVVKALFHNVDTLTLKDYQSHHISFDRLIPHLQRSGKSFKIDLSDNDSRDWKRDSLSKLLKQIPVTALKLRNTPYLGNLDWLTFLLPNMHDLEELDISSTKIQTNLYHHASASEKRTLEEFINALTQHRTLKKLHMQNNLLCPPALKILFDAIPNLKLQVFNIYPSSRLNEYPSCAESWKILAEKIKDNTTLVAMDLPALPCSGVSEPCEKIRQQLKKNQLAESKPPKSLSPPEEKSPQKYIENFFSSASSTSTSTSVPIQKLTVTSPPSISLENTSSAATEKDEPTKVATTLGLTSTS
ncbi:MAG TPA: hypothetical protein VHE99_11145 [Gammaproteobacteria bacterium]|nr:hypothetical protein [Gammaproteobacteria bacterium]